MGTWSCKKKEKEGKKRKKEKSLYWIWKSTIGLKIYFDIEKKSGQSPYLGLVVAKILKDRLLGNEQFRICPSLGLCAPSTWIQLLLLRES